MYLSVAEPRRHVNYLQLISSTYLCVSVDPPFAPLKYRITSLTRNGDLLGWTALVCGAEDKSADGGLVPCESSVGGDCGAIVVSEVVKHGGAGVILPGEGGAAGALRPCAGGSIGGGGMLNVDKEAVAGPRKRKIGVIQTILCYIHFWPALRHQSEKKARLLRTIKEFGK